MTSDHSLCCSGSRTFPRVSRPMPAHSRRRGMPAPPKACSCPTSCIGPEHLPAHMVSSSAGVLPTFEKGMKHGTLTGGLETISANARRRQTNTPRAQRDERFQLPLHRARVRVIGSANVDDGGSYRPGADDDFWRRKYANRRQPARRSREKAAGDARLFFASAASGARPGDAMRSRARLVDGQQGVAAVLPSNTEASRPCRASCYE